MLVVQVSEKTRTQKDLQLLISLWHSDVSIKDETDADMDRTFGFLGALAVQSTYSIQSASCTKTILQRTSIKQIVDDIPNCTSTRTAHEREEQTFGRRRPLA